MSPTQAGDAAGVFFWGFLLLQIPGGYLAERWSAKRFVSVLLVLWGICAMGCGLVRSWGEFRTMRFLLGVAEGGVWPATIVLLSHWFPRGERARANAYWMLCLPVAVVISSPLSGWILGRWDWRVLLIAEGGLPILWLVVWWWFIDDHPHEARWISLEERDFLVRTLAREATDVVPLSTESYLRTLLRPQVLAMVVMYFLLLAGSYGYLFWLPTALSSAKAMSNFQVGVLNALPYGFTAIGMVLLSQHSDRKGERRGHVAVGLAWSGTFLLASVFASHGTPLMSFFFICLVGAGCYGALGPFWAIPSETLPRSVAGSAIGLLTGLGNLGAYFGTLAVGILHQRTGNFLYGFGLLSVGWFLGAALAMQISPRVAESRK